MRTKKKAPRKRTRTAKRRTRPRPPTPATAIQGWSTDPLSGVPPLQLPAPALPGTALATRIIAPNRAPAAQVCDVGTAGFRYWTTAEALRRAAAFWNGAGAYADPLALPDNGPARVELERLIFECGD